MRVRVRGCGCVGVASTIAGESPSGGADGHVGVHEATGGQETDKDGRGAGPGDTGGGAGGPPGIQ